MKMAKIRFILLGLLLSGCWPVFAQKDLPLSDRIKILKITPYGEETKRIFEIDPKDISYESMKSAMLERIKSGYKPDCNCDYDNDYFIQLGNRPIFYGSERDNPAVITFAGSLKPDGDPLMQVEYKCEIVLSKNKKFAGLIFKQIINTGMICGHFMLVNSKGEVQWETPHKMMETESDNFSFKKLMFPNDIDRSGTGHYAVSNDGKVFFNVSHMNEPEKFWILFDRKGKMIKRESIWCARVEFSPDGDYFLLAEDRNKDHHSFDPDSGTSCYDGKGNLLWRKDDILPIDDAGYFISPSGKSIVACNKDSVYYLCMLGNDGKRFSKAQEFEEERISVSEQDTSSYYPFWSPSEDLFIWGKSIVGRNLKYIKPIETFSDITKKRQDAYRGLYISDIVPITNKHLIAIGNRRRNSFGKTFDPPEKYRFIAILDYRMDLVGINFFEIDKYVDRHNRIILDKTALKVYLFTNELAIEIQFYDSGEKL
jgi:hypothetical protein